MHKINVELEKSYEIIIDKGILANIGEYVKKAVPKATKALVITDSNVAPLYYDKVKASLETTGYAVSLNVFTAGEKSKNYDVYIDMVNDAAKNGLTREDVIIALGGGVVGDMAGFAAATYMRGISYVQVPTTLLAGIDSSIGGKTGLDLQYGKNLAGAFHQPSLVVYDLDTLKTLPEDEVKNGLGEGIKYGVLIGGRCFELLENGLNDSNMEEFVYICAKYKADVVAKDEKETGLRKLLNLGHTYGHAMEKIFRYELPHGLCVIKGILVIANAGLKRGILSNDDYSRIFNTCEKYGVICKQFVAIPDAINEIAGDKKAHADGTISIISIEGIGSCKVEKVNIGDLISIL